MKKNIEEILEEIKECEKIRGKIPLVPIISLYNDNTHDIFVRKFRDYIWFEDRLYNR